MVVDCSKEEDITLCEVNREVGHELSNDSVHVVSPQNSVDLALTIAHVGKVGIESFVACELDPTVVSPVMPTVQMYRQLVEVPFTLLMLMLWLQMWASDWGTVLRCKVIGLKALLLLQLREDLIPMVNPALDEVVCEVGYRALADPLAVSVKENIVCGDSSKFKEAVILEYGGMNSFTEDVMCPPPLFLLMLVLVRRKSSFSDLVLLVSLPVNSMGDLALVNADVPAASSPLAPVLSPVVTAVVGGGDPLFVKNGCVNLNVALCGVNSIISPLSNGVVESSEAIVGGGVNSGEGMMVIPKSFVDVSVNLIEPQALVYHVGDNSGVDVRLLLHWLHCTSKFKPGSDSSSEYCGGADPGHDFKLMRDSPVISVASYGRARGRGRRGR
ncbi:hypothetical protein MA16_Dca003711 [Dendrobium catenatum]|uniref:Uncharacterized protein n=1 Tax=Dendrobium catenatum TaxID=906689 RepID=A0A2I0WFT0_9ASPA|nr:hypothetical protein MA16_Dca003711 [Dendrobium catenatum]